MSIPQMTTSCYNPIVLDNNTLLNVNLIDGDNSLGVGEIHLNGVSCGADELLSSKLLNLYLQGKDLDANKDEYLNIILALSYVNKESLKAIEVFEQLKKLRKLCL